MDFVIRKQEEEMAGYALANHLWNSQNERHVPFNVLKYFKFFGGSPREPYFPKGFPRIPL